MSFLKKIGNSIKGAWAALDYIPDCPACKGTGKPTAPYENWADLTWWMGEQIYVCHNCKGHGKV